MRPSDRLDRSSTTQPPHNTSGCWICGSFAARLLVSRSAAPFIVSSLLTLKAHSYAFTTYFRYLISFSARARIDGPSERVRSTRR